MPSHCEDALQQLSQLIDEWKDSKEPVLRICHYVVYEAFPKSDSPFDAGYADIKLFITLAKDKMCNVELKPIDSTPESCLRPDFVLTRAT
jgi:hypothetical protein